MAGVAGVDVLAPVGFVQRRRRVRALAGLGQRHGQLGEGHGRTTEPVATVVGQQVDGVAETVGA